MPLAARSPTKAHNTRSAADNSSEADGATTVTGMSYIRSLADRKQKLKAQTSKWPLYKLKSKSKLKDKSCVQSQGGLSSTEDDALPFFPSTPSTIGFAARVCTVLGIPVYMHLLLPAHTLLPLIACLLTGSDLPSFVLTLIASGPLLFGTVLVHELGHALEARRFGVSIEYIILWPLGGLEVIGQGSVTPKQQLLISLAGPCMHIPMLAVWMGLFAAVGGGSSFTLSLTKVLPDADFLQVLCVCMIADNLSMCLFNLFIPCYPLDGAMMLSSILQTREIEPNKTVDVSLVISVILILVLTIVTVFSFLGDSGSTALTLFTTLWMFYETVQLVRFRQTGSLASHPMFGDQSQSTGPLPIHDSQGDSRGAQV